MAGEQRTAGSFSLTDTTTDHPKPYVEADQEPTAPTEGEPKSDVKNPEEKAPTPPGDEGGEGAGAAAATDKAKPASSPRLFKVKVDGLESEVDEEELLKGYQLAKSSQKRFMEAGKIEKQAKDIMNALAEDPRGILMAIFKAKLGNDEAAVQRWYEICSEEVAKAIELENMPEAEREAFKLREENQRLKMETEEFRRKEQEKKQNEAVNETARQKMIEISQKMATAKLPVTEESLDGVVLTLIRLREAGYDPTPEDAIELYKEDLQKRREDELKTLPIEEVLRLYPELASQVTEANLTAVKAKRSAPSQTSESGKQEPEPEPETRLFRKKPVSVSSVLR